MVHGLSGAGKPRFAIGWGRALTRSPALPYPALQQAGEVAVIPGESTMSQSRMHRYTATVTWTGAAQGPTRDYRSYSREYRVAVPRRLEMRGSADPSFRGDAGLPNPEDLLIAALSA